MYPDLQMAIFNGRALSWNDRYVMPPSEEGNEFSEETIKQIRDFFCQGTALMILFNSVLKGNPYSLACGGDLARAYKYAEEHWTYEACDRPRSEEPNNSVCGTLPDEYLTQPPAGEPQDTTRNKAGRVLSLAGNILGAAGGGVTAGFSAGTAGKVGALVRQAKKCRAALYE
ncbi:MAG: hypothetical protein LBT92_02605 [Rickettsiales bacterium]|jgi:hypothetical protein|nr:hypothetical protein [Rickettsiales bacterium]